METKSKICTEFREIFKLGRKKIGVEKILGAEKFWPEKILGAEKVWPEKNLYRINSVWRNAKNV